MAFTVQLPADAENFVQDVVAAGRHASADEVIASAVRLLMLEYGDNAYARYVDKAVEEGLADVAAGRTRPADEVFAELSARLEAKLADRRLAG